MNILEKGINLEIRRLKDAIFESRDKTMYCRITGYCFYAKGYGYLAFAADNESYPVPTPYIPKGGRKALEAILAAGGLTNYEGIEWLHPTN